MLLEKLHVFMWVYNVELPELYELILQRCSQSLGLETDSDTFSQRLGEM